MPIDNRDQGNNGALNALNTYSQSLSKSADALLTASKTFQSALNGFDKTSDGLSDTATKHVRDLEAKYKDANMQSRNQDKDYLTNRQKIGKTLNDEFKRVASYAIKQFSNAFNNVISNYESSYTTITTRMNQSNQQYTENLIRMTKTIQDKNLKAQFSQADWTKELITVLDTGIRGQTARDMAYQNMITNKVLPMINTNTKSYTRLSKTFGDKFTEATTAMGLYTQQLYGAQGLEEGRADQLYNVLEKEILLSAKESGMSAEEAGSMVSDYMNIYNKMANEAGVDAADDFLNVMKDAFQGNISSNIVAADVLRITGANYADPAAMAQVSAEQWANAYYEAMDDFIGGSAQTLSILSNQAGIGGFNYDAAADVYLRGYGRGSTGDTSSAEYKTFDQIIDDLAGGAYQSKTAQQTKWNENVTSKLADISASLLPDSVTMLNGIGDTIDDWFRIWLSWEAVDTIKGGSGGSNLPTGLSKFFGLNGAEGSSKVSSFLGSTGGRLLGAAGGVALTVSDALTGYQEGGLGRAFGKALTGSSDHDAYADTDIKNIILTGAGDVLKNTFKGAAIGTAAGHPIIGAIVGGVTGLFGTLTDVFSEDNILARSTKRYAESLDKVSKAQDDYEATIKKTENVSDLLTEAQSGSQSAFEKLKETYPEYMGNLENVNQLDATYIELLKMKIAEEKKQMAGEFAESGAESGKSAIDLSNKYDVSNAAASMYIEARQSGMSSAEALQAAGGNKEVIARQLSEMEGQGVTYSFDDNGTLIRKTHRGFSEVKSEPSAANLSGLDYTQDARSKLLEAYGIDFNSYVGLQEQLQSVLDSYGINPEEYINFSKHNLKDRLDDADAAKNIMSMVDSLSGLGQKLMSEGSQLDSATYTKDYFQSQFSLWPSKFNIPGSFKIGLDYVPFDNYPVLAHKGEMILTEQTANTVRDILTRGESSGISNLFNTISGSTQTASALGDTATNLTINTVVSAIQEQTIALSAILNEILNTIKGNGSGISSPVFSNTLLSFAGL